MTFDTIQIQSEHKELLAERGIIEPTEIQKQAIPLIREGRDVIAQSQTGTGKTLAYLLPLLQNIDTNKRKLQSLVLVPTRELGMQILREIEALDPRDILKATSLIGGAALHRQLKKLKLHPQIVVGTPGRVLELIKLRKLKMNEVRTIVVDEVDQVMELGNMRETEDIFKSALRDRQLVFTSATIPEELSNVAEQWMNDPVSIYINPSERTSSSIKHVYFISELRDKIDTLRRILRHFEPKSGIIFVNDRDHIERIEARLKYLGFTVEALYGEINKQDRAVIMNRFREGKLQFLLGTDVAARGLDIDNVTHVINFDPPLDADHYIHRVGRTGRMGKAGTAVSIVMPQQKFVIEKFAKQLNIEIELKEMHKGDLIPAKHPYQASRKLVKPKKVKEKTRNRKDNSKDKGAPKWLKNKTR